MVVPKLSPAAILLQIRRQRKKSETFKSWPVAGFSASVLFYAQGNQSGRLGDHLFGTSSAQFFADHELESRPDFTHSADLDVDPAHRQGDFSNQIFGDFTGDFG